MAETHEEIPPKNLQEEDGSSKEEGSSHPQEEEEMTLHVSPRLFTLIAESFLYLLVIVAGTIEDYGTLTGECKQPKDRLTLFTSLTIMSGAVVSCYIVGLISQHARLGLKEDILLSASFFFLFLLLAVIAAASIVWGKKK